MSLEIKNGRVITRASRIELDQPMGQILDDITLGESRIDYVKRIVEQTRGSAGPTDQRKVLDPKGLDRGYELLEDFCYRLDLEDSRRRGMYYVQEEQTLEVS